MPFHPAWTRRASFLLLVLGTNAVADMSLTVVNNCGTTIWPAVTSSDGGPSQGWEAQPGFSMTMQVPETWNGLAWARQDCHTYTSTYPGGGLSCATGDCGSMNCSNTFIPYNVTTLPFSTGQQKGSEPYAIDISGGVNVPVKIASDVCSPISCLADFAASCPQELRSATDASGKALNCATSCFAGLGTTSTDKWNNCHGSAGDANIEYYQWYKSGCPDAIVNPSDPMPNSCSTLAVKSLTVTFCPDGTVDIAAPANPSAAAATSALQAASTTSTTATTSQGSATSPTSTTTSSASATSTSLTASSSSSSSESTGSSSSSLSSTALPPSPTASSISSTDSSSTLTQSSTPLAGSSTSSTSPIASTQLSSTSTQSSTPSSSSVNGVMHLASSKGMMIGVSMGVLVWLV